jgi:hypothetical protein
VGGSTSGTLQRASGSGGYPVLNKTIIVSNTDGPHFNPCAQQPQFEWKVAFSPASSMTGYIVQRVESTYEARDCNGNINNTFQLTPLYWEAWRIAGVGLDPDPPGGHDTWRRTFDIPTYGSWSIKGTLYQADAIPADFVAPNPNVPEAVDVPSTTTDPTREVLGSPIGRRKIAGEWNCCDADPKNHYHRQKD